MNLINDIANLEVLGHDQYLLAHQLAGAVGYVDRLDLHVHGFGWEFIVVA